MIEIKESKSFDDTVEIAILLRKFSGLSARDARRRRGIYAVYFVLMLGFLYFSIRIKGLFGICLSGALAVFSLLNIIFAEKINNKNIRRNMERNFKVINKKYNRDFTEPQTSLTKIHDGIIEMESQDKVTKCFAKDYIKNWEEGRFYVLEFKNGSYIFFKKETFKTKDDFYAVINEIEKS